MDITTLTFDKRDEFTRKAIAEKIISLLQSPIEISPMLIDGSWGTGKTEFCHKLINLMRKNDSLMGENESHHLIYIDAFKADHADEPLMTVLAEVIKVLPDKESKDGFMKKALPAVRYGLKTIAKAGVSHLLKQEVADIANDFDKQIQGAADKAIDATVESVLKDHVKAEQNLKTLQTALAEIAATKPIILFIDELDRCRPNFAVEMLEVIKHTFDVVGVSFVLITNTTQLKASINHCYGSAVDAQRYLDKFLKFTFRLAEFHGQSVYHQTHVSITHYKKLVNNSPILKECALIVEQYNEIMEHLIKLHNISLREIETLVRNLEIYQTLTDKKGLASNVYFGYKLLRLFAVLLCTFQPKLADTFLNKQVDAKALGKFLGQLAFVQYTDSYGYPEHYQILAVMLGQECTINSELFITKDEEQIEHWKKIILSYFNNRWFNFDEDQASGIVVETLKTMSLSS